jgi:hypothetical protein
MRLRARALFKLRIRRRWILRPLGRCTAPAMPRSARRAGEFAHHLEWVLSEEVVFASAKTGLLIQKRPTPSRNSLSYRRRPGAHCECQGENQGAAPLDDLRDRRACQVCVDSRSALSRFAVKGAEYRRTGASWPAKNGKPRGHLRSGLCSACSFISGAC